MRRDTGPPPVGRQIRTVMAKVNQSHLLLATVFLVLGTVVHDVSTATVNKDLEAFIQKSSRMIAAPFPSKSGAPGNDGTTPHNPTTAATEMTSEKLSTTAATETTSEKLSTTAATETTSEKLPTTAASDTTGKISTTTAAPQTTTEALPSDDIWKEIEKELNEITDTLNELKEFVDNPVTTTPAVPTTMTETPEPTTTPAVTVEVEGQEKQPLKARQMIPPLYFLSKIDLGIFKEEQKICKLDDPADLCERLTSVLKNVEAIGNKIPDLDEATMNDLNIVSGNKTELKDVSNSMHENPSFVTVNLDSDVFDSRVETVNETIAAAIDDIDSKLSETDNTLAIVLGTIFGILGVALIIGAIVMYRKKNKRKQGTSMNMERNVNPSSRHSSQSGE
ncbi:uncharacterized protein LOC135213669 isoform X2 [Macrobrachium nipponense]|uniref:uncharacterized protein LOC135213669 isoform X2 n=1 Tax=Macrobrachium nipponense TaxID=159736 RepID=UPI0030C8CCE9